MNIFKIDSTIEDDFDIVDKMINIYCIAKNRKITPSLCRKLVYYIVYGCSKKTRRIIQTKENLKSSNIRQADYQLIKKGFLYRGNKNYNDIRLTEDLIKIKESFLDNKTRNLFVKFE